MELEVQYLLEKEAIECVPPREREAGLYRWYFIVPKNDGGLQPIIDIRELNRSLRRFRLKILTITIIVSQIRSEDWFLFSLCLRFQDTYFHIFILPQHRKFLRFTFGGKVYQDAASLCHTS